MHTRQLAIVDTFTDEPLTGTQTGVVPDANGLSSDQLLAISRELPGTETAFLSDSNSATYRLRTGSHTGEREHSRHAAIAALSYLCETTDGETTLTLETETTTLEAERDPDGTVWRTCHQSPTVRPVSLEYDRLAAALGVSADALEGARDDLPLAVVSTGLPVLAVPITYLADVGSASPEMARLEELTEAVGAVGVSLFTFDTLTAAASVHGRLFTPMASRTEYPATATATAALGAYLDQYGAFDEWGESRQFEQGYYLDRPGSVHVRIDDTVSVGGRGVTVLEGTLTVPADDDDDILVA